MAFNISWYTWMKVSLHMYMQSFMPYNPIVILTFIRFLIIYALNNNLVRVPSFPGHLHHIHLSFYCACIISCFVFIYVTCAWVHTRYHTYCLCKYFTLYVIYVPTKYLYFMNQWTSELKHNLEINEMLSMYKSLIITILSERSIIKYISNDILLKAMIRIYISMLQHLH